jgi:hypothetical protein
MSASLPRTEHSSGAGVPPYPLLFLILDKSTSTLFAQNKNRTNKKKVY